MIDREPSLTEESGPEVTLRIACECYTDTDFFREALAGLPDLDGQLEWGAPFTPDSSKLTEAELVLIVSDRPGLLSAIGRSVIYRNLGLTHLLLYVRDQDDADLPTEVIPALIIARSKIADRLLELVQMLLETTLRHGLGCIDWMDTCHILAMGGRTMMERAAANEPEAAIRTAVDRLKASTSGHAIQGILAGLFSNGSKLQMRAIHDLAQTCKQSLLTQAAGYDTYCIVAAPLMDWPDDNYYEVRLFASVDCCWPCRLGEKRPKPAVGFRRWPEDSTA